MDLCVPHIVVIVIEVNEAFPALISCTHRTANKCTGVGTNSRIYVPHMLAYEWGSLACVLASWLLRPQSHIYTPSGWGRVINFQQMLSFVFEYTIQYRFMCMQQTSVCSKREVHLKQEPRFTMKSKPFIKVESLKWEKFFLHRRKSLWRSELPELKMEAVESWCSKWENFLKKKTFLNPSMIMDDPFYPY